jgi:hypothetical protein
MSDAIHLSKFSEDLRNEVAITKDEWVDCASKIGNLRYVEDAFPQSIETFAEEFNDWKPVFWITEQRCYMKSSTFFNRSIYEKDIDIAAYLDAHIYSAEEMRIIYLPKYGVLVDNIDDDNIELTFSELYRLQPIFGSNFRRIFDAAAKERGIENASIALQSRRNIKKKPWWQFW